MTGVSRTYVENDGKIPGRPGKKWKIIAGCILGAFFLAVAVLTIANLSVLKLVFLPGNITISEREESTEVLKQLESTGDIGNFEISDDAGSVSFSSADKHIKVTSEYDGERLMRVSGEIDAGRIRVSTIDEGKGLARVMLSPYFGDAEITALLVRHSPGIIAGAMNDNIDMSFDIDSNYQVTIIGSTHTMVEFNIIAK